MPTTTPTAGGGPEDPTAAGRATSGAGHHLSDPRERVFVAERPWGSFRQLAHNEEVTVKVITVEPGHRLSLQRHDNRGEMWLVLDHAMRVEIDDRAWDAAPGELVWVPDGSVHRLANQLDTPCRIVEIAFGEFDEADIVRLEDDYARPEADARDEAPGR